MGEVSLCDRDLVLALNAEQEKEVSHRLTQVTRIRTEKLNRLAYASMFLICFIRVNLWLIPDFGLVIESV